MNAFNLYGERHPLRLSDRSARMLMYVVTRSLTKLGHREDYKNITMISVQPDTNILRLTPEVGESISIPLNTVEVTVLRELEK